jgi:hypothetical protein
MTPAGFKTATPASDRPQVLHLKPLGTAKTCPGANLITTNPTWTDLASNPALRGERPKANRLGHCASRFDHQTVQIRYTD